MGYNSGRFDIPVLLPYLRRYANEKKLHFSVVKRGSTYIQVKLGDIMIRDTLVSSYT